MKWLICRFFVIVSFWSLFSCSFEVKREQAKVGKRGISHNNIKKIKYDNLFIVDEGKCDSWQRPITRFKIEYPNDVEIDTNIVGKVKKRCYITIDVIKDEFVIGELSLCTSTNIKENDLRFGNQIALKKISFIEENSSNMKVISNGPDMFLDQKVHVLRLEIDSLFSPLGRYQGPYEMTFANHYPSDHSINPVNIVWFVNKEYKEEVEEVLTGIWSTFEFL